LTKGMTHYWLTTEGVFGVALGVSTGMVFMFVLFGALLESAGAGNYFIRTAFAGLGHMRGGPAKAAVVSSGNDRSGLRFVHRQRGHHRHFHHPVDEKGRLLTGKSRCGGSGLLDQRPVDAAGHGAAAFLMVEYVGISYIEVIKHAFLPAIISYVALVYIVHLEACKMGSRGCPNGRPGPWPKKCSRSSEPFCYRLIMIGGNLLRAGLDQDRGRRSHHLLSSSCFIAYLAYC
jgi:hypothetical protein